MRNNNIIFAAIGILLAIILLFILVFTLGGESKDVVKDTSDFPDTGGNSEFPTGGRAGLTSGTENTGDVKPETDNQSTSSPLRLITKEPVSGAIALDKRNGIRTGPYVRYVERATGNIRETPLDHIEEPTTLSTKTILRVSEALFAENGSTTVLRYLNEAGDTIFSYLGTLTTTAVTSDSSADPATSKTELRGRPLPNNIISLAFSQDGGSLFYLQRTDKGATGFLESIATGERSELWSSPFKNLTASWGGATIAVQLNPTPEAVGTVWLIDRASKRVTTPLTPQYGLAALISPRGTHLLYSFNETQGGTPLLRSLALKTNEVQYLSMATLVEKCAWSEDERYLYCALPRTQYSVRADFVERWNQGLEASDDALWRFDVTTGTAKELIDPHEVTKSSFDIVSLSVTPREEYLVFRTRYGNKLWGFELPEEEGEATSTPTTSDTR